MNKQTCNAGHPLSASFLDFFKGLSFLFLLLVIAYTNPFFDLGCSRCWMENTVRRSLAAIVRAVM